MKMNFKSLDQQTLQNTRGGSDFWNTVNNISDTIHHVNTKYVLGGWVVDYWKGKYYEGLSGECNC